MLSKKTVVASVVTLVLLSGCGESSPEELLTKGQSSLEDGHVRAAIIEFKSALQKDPTLVSARIGLAKASIEKRDFKSAINELEKIKSSEGDTDTVRLLLARAYHNNANDMALLSMEDAKNNEILYYQLLRYVGPGDDEKIDSILNKMSPESPFYALASALVSSARGDGEKVVSQLPGATGDKVFDSELFLLTSTLHAQAGDTEAATQALGRYHQLNPGDNARRLQYAQGLVFSGDAPRAKEVLAPLLKAFPQHGLINQLQAQVLFEQGDYQGAESAAILALTADPNNMPSRLVAAYSAAKLGDEEGALENLEFVIDKLPPNHPAERLYLRLKASLDDPSLVAKQALNLTDIQPEDQEFLSALGLEALRVGDRSTAEALAQKAQSVEATATSQLGLLQLSLNQEDAAFKTLEAAFSESPDNAGNGNTLAAAYLAKERYEEARQLARKWQSGERRIEGLMLEAVVFSRLNDYQKAKEHFGKVLEIKPDHFMARSGVIESLLLLGEREQAKTTLSQWVGEPGMLELFRGYVATLRSLSDGDVGAENASLLSQWISQGKVSGDNAYYLLAQTYFLSGQAEEALGALSEVGGDALKTRADYWILKATAHEMTQDNTAALEAYQSWQAIAPENPMPVLGEVRLLSESGKQEEALKVLDKALPNLTDPMPGYLLKGHLLLKTRQWGMLRDLLDGLSDDARNSITGQALLGALSLYDNEAEKAVEQLTPYVDISGSDEFLRFLVAALQRSEGEVAVVDYLSQYLEKHPQSAVANFLIANEFAQSGQYQRAQKHYETIRSAASENAMFANNYAYVLLQLGNKKEALALAQKAVSIDAQNPSYVDTLIEVLVELERREDAQGVFDSFVESGGEPHPQLNKTIQKLNR